MWTNFEFCLCFWILENHPTDCVIVQCSLHKTSKQHCVLAMCDVLSQNAVIVPQMHKVHCTIYWCHINAHGVLHQNARDTMHQKKFH